MKVRVIKSGEGASMSTAQIATSRQYIGFKVTVKGRPYRLMAVCVPDGWLFEGAGKIGTDSPIVSEPMTLTELLEKYQNVGEYEIFDKIKDLYLWMAE